jgi:hypothetical protein
MAKGLAHLCWPRGADRLQVLGDVLAAANSVVEDDQRATLLCDLLTVLPPESALGACCLTTICSRVTHRPVDSRQGP